MQRVPELIVQVERPLPKTTDKRRRRKPKAPPPSGLVLQDYRELRVSYIFDARKMLEQSRKTPLQLYLTSPLFRKYTRYICYLCRMLGYDNEIAALAFWCFRWH